MTVKEVIPALQKGVLKHRDKSLLALSTLIIAQCVSGQLGFQAEPGGHCLLLFHLRILGLEKGRQLSVHGQQLVYSQLSLLSVFVLSLRQLQLPHVIRQLPMVCISRSKKGSWKFKICTRYELPLYLIVCRVMELFQTQGDRIQIQLLIGAMSKKCQPYLVY